MKGVWLLVGVLFVATAAFIIRERIMTLSPYRQIVAIIADPVIVLSVDAKRKKPIILTFSPDAVVRGALGYGKFSLRSLAVLDDLDKREGALIRSSLSRSVGLPIMRVERTPASIEQILSMQGLRRIDGAPALIRSSLPDGSEQQELDESRVDALMGSEFFDTDIREESLSVAIYNTTDTAAVGKVFARQLTHIGVRLVMVGNKTPAIPTCRVVTRKGMRTTYTAQFLQHAYQCELITDERAGGDIGADILLELGEKEASYYSS